jgi:hypothetical protein
MKRAISFVLALLFAGLLCVVQEPRAQVPMTGAGRGAPGFTASCSQSSAFIARTSGLSTPSKTLYDTLICGLETDGVGCSNSLDSLYFLAAPDATTLLLNLCSASFPLVAHGTVTFTANVGVVGDGTTGYYDTQFNPSTATSPNFVQNSASIGAYLTNARVTGQTYSAFGANPGISAELVPWWTDNNTYFDINGFTFPHITATTVKGMWVVDRTVSTTAGLSLNGSSVSSQASTSGAPGNSTFFLLARNVSGSPDRFSADTMTAAFFGRGLSSGEVTNVSTRINNAMTTLGINVY